MAALKFAPVYCVGSINADFQIRVPREAAPSETLLGDAFVRLSGGKAANRSRVAQKLGHPTVLFGSVGEDDLAAQALTPLIQQGVDARAVVYQAGQATGTALITVPPNGKKRIVLATNANVCWSDAQIDAMTEALSKAPAGAVLAFDNEAPSPVVSAAADAAHRRGLSVVFDPSVTSEATELLALADCVTPNAGEASALTGIDVHDAPSAQAAAHALLKLGARAACVKLADGGCVVSDGKRTRLFRAWPVPVVDTTGAGDAFAGTLAATLAEHKNLFAAARRAVLAAQAAVTAYGSQPAYLNRAELAAFACTRP